MLTAVFTLITALNFNISAVVTDRTTGQAIIGASVQVVELKRGTVTDATGRFTLGNLPEGEYTLRVSHVGYQTVDLRFFVQNGLTDAIALEPRDVMSEEVIIRSVRAGAVTPVSQKTLGKTEIETTYFGQEMPVLLTQTPGVNAYSDAGNAFGYAYLRLRGVDQTRINFTLNGLPLNEPEDQGVYFANFADFGNSLQSVQVQRGVGTSTWGTAAYAGSVNFESISLADSLPSAEVQIGRGSFNSYRVSPEFSTGRLKNGFAFYGRASLLGTDGYRYRSGTQAVSFFVSGAYFGKRDLVKFTAFSGRTRNEMAYVPVSLADIRRDPRTNYLTPDETDQFAQDLAQLQYTRRLSPSVSLVASAYYIRLSGGFDIRFDQILQNFAVASDFGGAVLNLSHGRNGFSGHLGLHANTYRRDHFSGIRPFVSERLYFNSGFKNELSAFYKANYALGRFNLFADAQLRTVSFRYVPEKSYNLPEQRINWTFFNPKAGLTYQATGRLSLYASVGRTSREPTRTDMFAGFDDLDTANRSLIGDFARVRPESVTNTELGAVLTLPALTLRANVFDMRFRNEIAAIGQLSYIGLPLRKNVPESFRRGAEWDATWRIRPNLVFTHNAAYLHARIREYTNDADGRTFRDVAPLLSPAWILNQEIAYRTPPVGKRKAHAEVALGSRYVSESFLANDNDRNFVTSAFHLLNLRVALVVAGQRLTFAANNLTDELYFTGGQVTNGESYYFAQAGRNYFATLHLRF